MSISDLPEYYDINRAHPVWSKRHDLYQEALRLVGQCHEKGELVDLVNWLLHRAQTTVEHPVTRAGAYEPQINIPKLPPDWTWQKLTDAVCNASDAASGWKAVATLLVADLEGQKHQNRQLHQAIAKTKASNARHEKNGRTTKVQPK